MPAHHPDDSLLLEYAAGSLSEAKALLVATHLALCPACRQRVRSGEMAAAAVVFGEESEAVAAGAPPDVSGEMVETPAIAVVPPAISSIPEPLRDYLGAAVSDLPWEAVGLGLRAYRLPAFRSSSTSVRLLSIPPGRRMPRHTHEGEELTLVLRGSFSDATGLYQAGDVATADASIDHQPRAGADEECICLAVEDAPLRFTGWTGAFFNTASRLKGV
jgi:putative transcriptional regulator